MSEEELRKNVYKPCCVCGNSCITAEDTTRPVCINCVQKANKSLIIHNKCGLPVEFCECKDAEVKYNWETGMYEDTKGTGWKLDDTTGEDD